MGAFLLLCVVEEAECLTSGDAWRLMEVEDCNVYTVRFPFTSSYLVISLFFICTLCQPFSPCFTGLRVLYYTLHYIYACI